MSALTITSAKVRSKTAQYVKNTLTVEEDWVIEFTGKWDPVDLLESDFEGLPQMYQVPSWNDYILVTSLIPAPESESRTDDDNPGGVASLKVTYETKTYDLARRAQSPLERAPVIQLGGSDLVEYRLNDAEGTAIVNSAGDFYQDLPAQPVQCLDFSITLNLEDNPAEIAAQYSNTQNNGTWYGQNAGTVWLGKITARQVTESFGASEITYWETTFPGRVRPDGWAFKPVDVGLYEIVESEVLRCLDDNNEYVTSPVPLDGSGGKLGPDEDPVVFPPDGYKVLKPADFSTLDLPNPFE